MLPRPPNPLERRVVTAALIAMCLAPIEVRGSNISSVQPRDPVSFQPDAFSALLNELSYSPDSRVSIHSGRLSYIESYKHSTRARWYRPHLRPPALPFQSSTKSAAPYLKTNQSVVYRTAVRFTLDPNYFMRLARRESSFDHLAKAPTSSATGLFQFTENTWLCLLRVYGARHGVAGTNAIVRTSKGRCLVPNQQARAYLLALRTNAGLNATVAAHHTQDNESELAHLLGRAPTYSERYVFHFLGRAEGGNLLTASPMAYGAEVAPRAAAANRTVFYFKDGRPRRVYEIIGSINRSFMAI